MEWIDELIRSTGVSLWVFVLIWSVTLGSMVLSFVSMVMVEIRGIRSGWAPVCFAAGALGLLGVLEHFLLVVFRGPSGTAFLRSDTSAVLLAGILLVLPGLSYFAGLLAAEYEHSRTGRSIFRSQGSFSPREHTNVTEPQSRK